MFPTTEPGLNSTLVLVAVSPLCKQRQSAQDAGKERETATTASLRSPHCKKSHEGCVADLALCAALMFVAVAGLMEAPAGRSGRPLRASLRNFVEDYHGRCILANGQPRITIRVANGA